MIGGNPACVECAHYKRNNFRGLICKAFPKGIPDEILLDGNKHDKPLLNQGNDIVFEPIVD